MGDVDGGFPSVADTIAAVRRELGREPNAASRLAGSLNNLAVQLGAMGRWEEALAILGALDPGPGVSGYYVVAFTTLTDILEKLGATGQARQLREMLEKKRASG